MRGPCNDKEELDPVGTHLVGDDDRFLHQQTPCTQDECCCSRADTPIKAVSTQFPHKLNEIGTYISHCKVENLTASTRSLNPATSCSILASVSFIRISCVLASSRILPFSKFRSNRTLACVRPISSLNLELNLARSLDNRSWLDRVNCASVLSALDSSLLSLAKSTFCV